MSLPQPFPSTGWLSRGGAVLLLLVSCVRPDDGLGDTGAEVTISVQGGGVLPPQVELFWLDSEDLIFTRILPEQGTFTAREQREVKVAIGDVGMDVGPRRIIARGIEDGATVSEGAGRIVLEVGTWWGVPIVLTAGKLPDEDDDKIPDRVDNCPAKKDPCSSPNDAAVPDAAADAPRDGAGEAPASDAPSAS